MRYTETAVLVLVASSELAAGRPIPWKLGGKTKAALFTGSTVLGATAAACFNTGNKPAGFAMVGLSTVMGLPAGAASWWESKKAKSQSKASQGSCSESDMEEGHAPGPGGDQSQPIGGAVGATGSEPNPNQKAQAPQQRPGKGGSEPQPQPEAGPAPKPGPDREKALPERPGSPDSIKSTDSQDTIRPGKNGLSAFTPPTESEPEGKGKGKAKQEPEGAKEPPTKDAAAAAATKSTKTKSLPAPEKKPAPVRPLPAKHTTL